MRILALTKLRANSNWCYTFAIAGFIGFLAFLRDTANLPYEVPAGVSILAIFVHSVNAVSVGLMDDLDDAKVDEIIEKSREMQQERDTNGK